MAGWNFRAAVDGLQSDCLYYRSVVRVPVLATALMTVNRIGLQPMLFPPLSRQRQTWQSSWVNTIVYSIKLVALELLLWYSLIGGAVRGACFADELSLD